MARLSTTIDLKERLASGETLFGVFLNLDSPLATEIAAMSGYDWLLVDLEHGAGDDGGLLAHLLAAQAHGVALVVRTETPERIRIGRVLDLGAAGVMLPRLESSTEAREALRHLRYPPQGDRGVATYNRSCAFGARPDRLRTANDDVVGIVQVESRGLVEEIDEVAKIQGVDVLFVGPNDLSYSLGVPGRTDDPSFQRALDAVLAASESAGVVPGIFASSLDNAVAHAERGFRFIAVGSDSGFLASASRATIQTLRQRIKEAAP